MKRGELNKRELEELKRLIKEDLKKPIEEKLKEIKKARLDVGFGMKYKKKKRRKHFLQNKLADIYARG